MLAGSWILERVGTIAVIGHVRLALGHQQRVALAVGELRPCRDRFGPKAERPRTLLPRPPQTNQSPTTKP